MKILFYAKDVGPAKNLGIIASEALKRNHRVWLGGNDDFIVEDSCVLDFKDINPDVVIASLSSFEGASQELGLISMAGLNKVPAFVVADTHRTWGREVAKGHVWDVTAIVAAEREIKEAKTFGYQDAIYLGGPPLWQDFYDMKFPTIPKETEELLIMFGGIKDAVMTDKIMKFVVASMKAVAGSKWKFIFKPHPNEWEKTKNKERRDNILDGVEILKRPESLTELLGSVDLTVHISGATDSVACSYLRLPSVCYVDEARRQILTKHSGSPDWYPAITGASPMVGPANMKEVIAHALTKEGLKEIKANQEKAYPIKRNDLRVEKIILNYIEEQVK